MNQGPTCPPACLALAHAMADAAAQVIRPHFRTRIAIHAKADASPVTMADRDAEAVMRRMIEAQFPDHGIRGEEFGTCRIDAEWVWVLDPIDGTKSFVSGSLAFGTQIALLHCGKPVLGMINQPITGERWVGAEGVATLGREPIRTSERTALDQAILYTSALEQFDRPRHDRFSALAASVRFTRLSHDCYAAGLLALGGIDLLVESDVFDYDILPQMPIVQAAGGIVTDWEGRLLKDAPSYATVLMAANGELHRAALDVLCRA
ncbi:inositol monophosphatase family protein [Aminobacter aminovorans]|uniref:inositol monophosphatase family protein n=1 Tax=Aminobacter aminovorans TaxID=83263 RepID=UPI00285539A6|nr:inositol monophosphatase family protein [Aminobacter aminovorans]MDR7221413.1 inositol-phosphate phosphatase/L-galactose 1-phosphate phosphatase/histidinol-phosphatase [Aminobacter aminovorans]